MKLPLTGGQFVIGSSTLLAAILAGAQTILPLVQETAINWPVVVLTFVISFCGTAIAAETLHQHPVAETASPLPVPTLTGDNVK